MKPYYNPADLTFDEVKDLQCPNCKGYKVKDDGSAPFFFAINILLTLSSYGLWLLIWIPFAILKSFLSKPPTEIKARCKLCGYRWVHKIQPN